MEYKRNCLLEEGRALENIVDIPAYFYSYAKKSGKRRCRVGPLFDKEGKLQKDPKTMANLLQDQYAAVFSDPENKSKKLPSSPDKSEVIIEDIEFTKEDIERAIDEIKENSACDEEDIPAIVLKQCKEALSEPIQRIWQKSIDTGTIPAFFKKQIITPVHKKKSRALPENYRPVSLTSHVIKIFERILRNKIVDHLERNEILCKDQHGFRMGF